MGWDDDCDGTYSNGADASCQVCGEPTDEAWHAYCSSCYRKEMCWTNRDDELGDGSDSGLPEPAFPGDERWKVAYLKGYREGWAAAMADKAA